MHDLNIVSWFAMIRGYTIHSYSKDSLKLFDLLKNLGIDLNDITFLCILISCNYVGLVNEGCKYLNSMSNSYCIIHGMNNYICIMDLLGCAGYLEEGMKFNYNMHDASIVS